MKHYHQLTRDQRYGIYSLLKTGHNQSEIAEVLDVHKSTISREVKRNRGQRGYRHKQAHVKATNRRQGKVRPVIDGSTWVFIKSLIEEDWSPEQIHGWLQVNMDMTVSHEWIYQYILRDKQTGGSLYQHLRCKKKRKKRYGANDRRGQLRNRLSIEERPALVETRERLGDWEADTIIGKRHHQAMVSIVERKSRFTLLRKVDRKTKTLVKMALIDLLEPFKKHVLTITNDNGREFADHESVAEALETTIYFAHPYSSWERGLNENTNGLIRQYFPKHRDFSTIAESEVDMVMNRLNNRPRKCLGFKTPNQVFFKESLHVALTT